MSGHHAKPALYNVGTAARLSGLTQDTLRAWERRHSAVKPVRSASGRRGYTDADIERLRLLKTLTDLGEPIGAIARLENSTLRTRIQSHASSLPPSRGRASQKPRVALLAPELRIQIQQSEPAPKGFELVLLAESVPELREALPATVPDTLVVELDQLGRDPIGALDDCLATYRVPLVIVVYSFAPSHLVSRLANRGFALLTSPLRLASLERAITGLAAARGADSLLEMARAVGIEAAQRELERCPERTWSDTRLAKVLEIESTVECECPGNLSSLVKGLVAFERYSLACESKSPHDAELHRALSTGTAHARRIMEDLLTRVCEHDGLEI